MADALKIPLANLYYLLCYAWDVLPERGLVDLRGLPGRRVNDLLAKVLLTGLLRVLRQGLERDFVATTADIRGLKGKLDLSRSVQRLLFQQGRAACSFTVLSPDTPANRAIRATLKSLIADRQLDTALRSDLASIYRRIPEVPESVITRHSFRKIQFHRNNRTYRLLVNICQLWLDRSFVDRKEGRVQFREFEQTESLLRRLFEAFVRNFYRHELPSARVRSVQLKWSASAARAESLRQLPELHTDTCIERDNDLIIIETKFTESTRIHHDSERLREAHLYQILAYLENLHRDRRFESKRLSGVLLYPQMGRQADHQFTMLGYPLLVRHVDLAADWQDIERCLLELADSCAVAAN